MWKTRSPVHSANTYVHCADSHRIPDSVDGLVTSVCSGERDHRAGTMSAPVQCM